MYDKEISNKHAKKDIAWTEKLDKPKFKKIA